MKSSGRWFFILALIFLLFSAGLIVTGHQGIALSLIIFVFWLLVAGTLLYLMDLKNEK